MLLYEAGGAYWPLATHPYTFLEPVPSAGGGAPQPLTPLCPCSPCLAYPHPPTPPSFPFGGCAGGAPGPSLFHWGGHRLLGPPEPAPPGAAGSGGKAHPFFRLIHSAAARAVHGNGHGPTVGASDAAPRPQPERPVTRASSTPRPSASPRTTASGAARSGAAASGRGRAPSGARPWRRGCPAAAAGPRGRRAGA